MRNRPDHTKQLKEKIKQGRVVLVIGTGVSVAATQSPSASWAGLLKSGIVWLQTQKMIDPQDAQTQLRLLNNKPTTQGFLSAAEDVVQCMGGPASAHYKVWLENTIGTLKAERTELLEAIHALRQHGKGHLLATTNYDDLLIYNQPNLTPITWREPDDLMRSVQQWNQNSVIYLHGYWRKPQTVVLDWDSYQAIENDAVYREDILSVWETHTWLYIGCGREGLNDPDLGRLLKHHGNRMREVGIYDYCLVRGQDEQRSFQTHFERQGYRIKAISYGDTYDALPDFLSKHLLS